MAEENGVRQAYICCDVAGCAELGEPCWSCGELGYSINLEVPENRYSPWTKAWHIPPQSAMDCYV